jgi:hypothetical protein
MFAVLYSMKQFDILPLQHGRATAVAACMHLGILPLQFGILPLQFGIQPLQFGFLPLQFGILPRYSTLLYATLRYSMLLYATLR